MARPTALKRLSQRPLLTCMVAIAITLVASALLQAASNQLQYRSLKLSDSQASKTVVYKFGFTPRSLDTIQTIVLQVCANDPFPGTPCTAPSGFDASGAVLADQTGDVGFVKSAQSSPNQIVLSRPPFASTGQASTYTLSGVVNPDTQGSYYVRVQTFADSDINGSANNYGGIAFVINASIAVQATVPPYLLFCAGVTVAGYNCDAVTGDYVDFGELGSRQASIGTTQMLAATNAKDGYTLRVTGTTLTSGNNVIPALPSPDISRPGVSQFGMNLRANSSPQSGLDVSGSGSGLAANGYNQINFFKFNDGDVVASSPRPDDARKYTATYIVNVNKVQSPGVYVSTLTYVALGSF